MKKIIGWPAVVVVLAGAGIGFYLWQQNRSPEPQPPRIETPQPPAAQAEPPAHYPVPGSADAQTAADPLPPLQASDRALLDALSSLWSRKTVTALFYPEGIVRRLVATIDNLPRKKISVGLFPVRPVVGSLVTAGEGEGLAIAPENAARYASYVRIAEMVDTKKLVALYVRFYPLFQQAYQDLGYPDGYFNDRLIVVIDHLLAAPADRETVRLIQPHVVYRFADQELETGSAGHKILLRIGQENAAKVKLRLREIRRELTGRDLSE